MFGSRLLSTPALRGRLGALAACSARSLRFSSVRNFHRSAVSAPASKLLRGLLVGAGVGGLVLLSGPFQAEAAGPPAPITAPPGLPEYTRAQVAQHKTKETRIWVTYGDGVYDITEFVLKHPGGTEKIMMAAGGAIEPFWAMYTHHTKPEIRSMLEEYRIGNLADAGVAVPVQNMYANEPERHSILHAHTTNPFNAEPPAAILADTYITSTDFHFKRNHLPVPVVDPASFKLEVTGEGTRLVHLSLDDLKRLFPKVTITATVQCAGNRRKELATVKPIKGLDWNVGAISTATWSGARLRDVLQYAGLTDTELLRSGIQHIQFEGLDRDMTTCYGASIPVSKAMHPQGDVILAYEMNGVEIPRDHGFPLRAVVPGTVGARSVKWLGRVKASKEESPSHWQQKDYKSFPPDVDWDTVDFSSAPAIQETPVQSAICEPRDGAKLPADDDEVKVKGYAWSGGGRGIVRVDVSSDGGKTWHTADLVRGADQPLDRAWAWTQWEASVPLPPAQGSVEICCRAVDAAYSNQPEHLAPIWNLRGVVNNAWHRVRATREATPDQ